MLILYPATLLSLLLFPTVFLVGSLGLPTYKIISSKNSHNFNSYFLIWMLFISLCCLIALEKISSTVLNNSSKSGHSPLPPDLREKPFKFLPLSTKLAVGLSYMTRIILRYVPFVHNPLRVFIMR